MRFQPKGSYKSRLCHAGFYLKYSMHAIFKKPSFPTFLQLFTCLSTQCLNGQGRILFSKNRTGMGKG